MILTSIFLVGCGGSSSNSNNNDGDKKPPTPVTNFKLSTIAFDDCNTETAYSNAVVLLHDANGAVIETHNTDAQGNLQLALPNNAKHFTVIGNDISNPQSSPIVTKVAHTQLNIEAMDYGQYFFYYGNDNCSCTNVELTFNELANTFNNYRVIYNGNNIDLDYETLNVCQEEQSIDLILKSESYGDVRSARINLAGQQYISVNEEHFDGQSTFVQYPNVPYDFHRQVSAINSDNYNAYRNFTFNDEPLYIFNDHADIHRAQVYKFINENINGVDLDLLSFSTQIVPENGVLDNFNIIDMDANFYNAFLSLFSSIENSGSMTQYDFSAINPQLDEVSIKLAWLQNGNEEMDWIIRGAPNATIPEFDFASHFTLAENNVEDLSLLVRLYAYQFDGSYSEYMKTKVARQSQSSIEAATPDFINSAYFRVFARY